jgi:glycine/D-amino acid oxidase-like deaminating enzyme
MQRSKLNKTVDVDVVVIGGGVQGLVILETLLQAGYSCALVSEGDIGAGQTLHSHGFLNTGFGLAGNELVEAAVEIVRPYLLEHGVELNDNWVILLPPPGSPSPLGSPASSGSPAVTALASLPAVSLPAGFSPAFAKAARKLPDKSFNKKQLVQVLMQGREDRMIRGSIAGFKGREPVEAVWVQAEASRATIEIGTKVVVVAAGCGSKRLLRDLVGPTPQIARIKHRVVHMVCLRAPRGALPAMSVVALPLGLLVAAHENSDSVTWYVTPMEMAGPSFDDVLNDAGTSALPAMLARAASALLALYTALPETAGLRIGHYAGYRQDIGEVPGVRMCQMVTGASNVIAALPSGLIGPWPNAADVLQLVRGLADPSGAWPSLPAGGEGVRAGQPNEDRRDFEWRSWEEWRQLLPQLGTFV